MPRRITHVEAAQQAADAGFRAIVAKCHYHNTVFDIQAMEPLLRDIPIEVYGGMALNSVAGGLNPHAADLALKMGGKIIWFPTISAKAHLDHSAHDATTQSHFQPRGIMQSELVSVFDEAGDLRPEVEQIIRLAKEAGALISTGHLDTESAAAVVGAAKRVGHTQVIVSHPNYVSDIDKEHVRQMTRDGAMVEHEIAMYAYDKIFPLEVLIDWISAIGPEHTTLGSDLGQVDNPLPIDGYRRLIERLLDAGISEADIRLMVRDNPARLIGLDA
jgi:hypothetical protein